MIRSLLFASCLMLAASAAAAQETPAADPAETGAGEAAAEVAAAAEPAAAAPVAAAPVAAKGDAKRGLQLTYTCQGCHGVTGYKNAYPNYHVPKIGGQSEVYLVNALTEYRQGKRKHPTMQAQAESFSVQDIADIAAYLSSLK